MSGHLSTKKNNYRKSYKWIALIIGVIGFTIGYFLKFYEHKGDLTALIDVTLTSIALIIAILEILELRTISEASSIAVKQALLRIKEIVSVSGIANGIRIAQDIQKYLIEGNLNVAHLRMKDLKFIIIPFKNDERFRALQITKELPRYIATLGVDINILQSELSGKKSDNLDTNKISNNLEEIVTLLIEYDTLIKSF